MSWKDKQNDNDSDLPELDMDSRQEIKPTGKPKRHYKEVYAVFKELLDIQPLTWNDWMMNTTEQKSADNLYTTKGIEQIEKALQLLEDNKDHKFCPLIHSPSSLVRKWQKLKDFKEKYDL